MRTFKLVAAASLACLSLSFTGCAETRNEFEIKGTVTINGEPIENGMINFVATDGVAQTAGGTITNGKYVAHVPPGPKTVLVLGNKVAGEEPLYAGVKDSPTRPILKTVTPVKYNAATGSDLKAEIKGNEEALDFALQGAAPSAAELRAR